MSLTTMAEKLVRDTQSSRPLKLPGTPAELDKIIGYTPRALQAELDRRDRRFNVNVLHRRFGKTVREVRKLLVRAVWCPFDDGRYAYTAPTYSMAEDIAWAYLENYATKLYENLGLKANDWIDRSKLALWVPTQRGNKARIRLYGTDSPKQRLRGLYLDGVVFDEWAEQPFSVWTEQVRPMLADDVRRGVDALGNVNQWADFIFTPKGRNHAYTMYQQAKMWFDGKEVVMVDPESQAEKRVKRDDWAASLFKASETGILGAGELTDMLTDMGRSKYDQEVECSFDAAVEGAIYAKYIEELRASGAIGKAKYNPLLPVDTAWDLGWDDFTAIWFVQETAGGPKVIDYYEASGGTFDHFAEVMAQKPYRYGRNYFPHDVEVHDQGTGKSRRAILTSLGVRVTTVTKHSPWDGIAAVQALFPTLTFDETACARGIDCLQLYRRDKNEKLGVLRQNPVHDWTSHAADAMRYFAMGRRAFRRPGSNPNSQVAAQM